MRREYGINIPPEERFRILPQFRVLTKQHTDVVVIRPPKPVSLPEVHQFADKLYSCGFLPVLLPHPSDHIVDDEGDELYVDDYRFYPTDTFREIGSRIFYKPSTGYSKETYKIEIGDMLRSLRQVFSDRTLRSLRSRMNPFPLGGGGCVYLRPYFIYADEDEGYELRDLVHRKFKWEEEDEWKSQLREEQPDLKFSRVYMTKISSLCGMPIEGNDLDFLVSLFAGKDGQPHLLTARSFYRRFIQNQKLQELQQLPLHLPIHVIPDEQAAKGGCNIADLRHGEVLVPPNEQDAPATIKILDEFAKATIIQAPPNFLCGGGSARCSISSFRFR